MKSFEIIGGGKVEQDNSDPLGKWWNQMHGGYPVPKQAVFKMGPMSYQEQRTIISKLQNAGIVGEWSRLVAGQAQVLVVPEAFAQRAANVLD